MPDVAAGYRLPHTVPKTLGLRIGLDDAVVLADEFRIAVAADRAEDVVRIGDATRRVGGGNQGVGADRVHQRLGFAQGFKPLHQRLAPLAVHAFQVDLGLCQPAEHAGLLFISDRNRSGEIALPNFGDVVVQLVQIAAQSRAHRPPGA